MDFALAILAIGIGLFTLLKAYDAISHKEPAAAPEPTRIQPPPAEQFRRELLARLPPDPRLIPEYLEQIISKFYVSVYLSSVTTLTQSGGYELFLDCCAQGLRDFIPRANWLLLERPPSTPLFTRSFYIFSDALCYREKDKWKFYPGERANFYSLVKPFNDQKERLKQLKVGDWDSVSPYIPVPTVYEGMTQRQYDKDAEKWRKEKQQAYEALSEMRAMTVGTILYPPSGNLEPRQTVKVPFELPQQKRFGAHYIIAPSGLGKTTLLTAMALDDIDRVVDGKTSIVLMDPKGEFTDNIKRLERLAHSDRLIVIEPEDNIAINPFDIDAGSIEHTVEAINYIFSSFAEKLTELQGTLLRPTIRALLLAYPNPTLDTLQRLLLNGLRLERGKLTGDFVAFAENHPDEDLRAFLLHEFTNDAIYKETRGQVLRRLRSLRENQIIKHWFTCTKTKFNIRQEIDRGRCIVINNSREILTPNGAEFFGRFFIAQLLAAGERRPSNSPANIPTFLYIDECDQVIKTDNNIETFIDKLRSKSIGVVLAHQRLYHFDGNKGTLDALLNAPIRFANLDDDAEALVKRFRVDSPDKLRFKERGRFAVYIRQHDPETAVIDVDKPEFRFMSDADYARIRASMRLRYGMDAPARAAPPPAHGEPDERDEL